MDFLSLSAETFDIVGKIFIAYAALRVHHRVLHEHKIDKAVFRSMKREQMVGISGIIFIIIGYFIHIFYLV